MTRILLETLRTNIEQTVDEGGKPGGDSQSADLELLFEQLSRSIYYRGISYYKLYPQMATLWHGVFFIGIGFVYFKKLRESLELILEHYFKGFRNVSVLHTVPTCNLHACNWNPPIKLPAFTPEMNMNRSKSGELP